MNDCRKIIYTKNNQFNSYGFVPGFNVEAVVEKRNRCGLEIQTFNVKKTLDYNGILVNVFTRVEMPFLQKNVLITLTIFSIIFFNDSVITTELLH